MKTGGISFPGASGPSSPIWLSANGDGAEPGFEDLSDNVSPQLGIQHTCILLGQDGA